MPSAKITVLVVDDRREILTIPGEYLQPQHRAQENELGKDDSTLA